MIIRVGFIISIILIYAPIFLPLFQSFIDETGLISLKWYISLIYDHGILISILNSIIIAIVSSTIGIIISIFNIYSRLYYISLIPLLIPEIMIGLILLIVYSCINRFVLIIIGHAIIIIAYSSISLRAAYQKQDLSIHEAASDLGASDISIFFRITLPLLWSAILEAWCIGFSISMDDVILAALFRVNTLPIELHSRIKSGNINYDISALIVIMFFIFMITVILINKVKRYLSSRER